MVTFHGFNVFVATVVVPGFIFGVNWAWRGHKHYNQTAPSDFLLAVMIFDLAAICTAHDLAPLIQDEVLRSGIYTWHVFLFMGAAILYWTMLSFGEPRVAGYYGGSVSKAPFLATLVMSWSLVFGLVSMHIGYFVWS